MSSELDHGAFLFTSAALALFLLSGGFLGHEVNQLLQLFYFKLPLRFRTYLKGLSVEVFSKREKLLA